MAIVLIPKNPNDSVQLRSNVDFRDPPIENLLQKRLDYWWRREIEKEIEKPCSK